MSRWPAAVRASRDRASRPIDSQMSEHPNPLRREGLVGRVAPYIGVITLALPLGFLSRSDLDPQLLLAAVLLTGLIATSPWTVPWQRLPFWAQAIPPNSYFLVVFLLREAEGGAGSGFTPLVVLPVVWLALYGTRSELGVSIAGVAATFVVPALLIGDPGYPDAELGRAGLWVAVAVIVGFTTHNLVREVRRRAAESEQRGEAVRMQAAIVESSGDAIIGTTPEAIITSWNPGAERLYGYSAAEIVSRPISILIPADRLGELAEILGKVQQGEGVQLETVRLRKDGTPIHVSLTFSPVVGEFGDLVGISAIHRDITGRKEAEATLRMSEERLRLVLDTAQEAFVSIDAKGVITAWNPEAKETFGWSHDEAVGQLLSELIIPPEYRDAHRQGIERFLATGQGPVLGKRLELEALHRDGRRFPVELTISPVRVEDTYVFHAFLRDISERRRAERYLAAQAAVSSALASSPELEQAMPSVLEALGDSMGWRLGQFWIVDHEAGVLRWRAAWHAPGTTSDVFEAKSREMTFSPGVGLPGRVWKLGEPTWIEDVTKDPNFPRARFAAQEGFHGALCLPLLSAGEVVGLIEFFSPEIREPDEDMIAMMKTISNQVGQFLERIRAEQEADRVKEEFFSLISHELRTPLAAIKGYMEFLLEGDGGELNEDGRKFLEVIGRKTGQLERIVGDLLFAARLESGNFMLDRTVVDLREILEGSVEGARPSVEQKQIAFDVKSEPVGECVGDRDRLAQLFDNLISNAVKYTPVGGQVEVTLRPENGHVLVEVEDTGIGIPARDQEHLFKRFFRASTAVKKRIPGVGLGLTIVKAIAEGHGGHVSVESKEGVGSKFSVGLPLTGTTTPKPTEKARSAAAS
jgi:PAS domain S-box-containing protein